MITSFNLFGRRILVKLVAMKLPDTQTQGMDSRCEDGLHIGFLDYDKIDFDFMTKVEIPTLQDQFRLSNYYVFDSGRAKEKMRGFHTVCLDKLPLAEWYQIIRHSSCEYAFKEAPRVFNEYKSWVIRTEAKANRTKPRYLFTVKSPFANHPQSLAHALFLTQHYGVPVDLKNQDDLLEMSFCSYKTYSKKG